MLVKLNVLEDKVAAESQEFSNLLNTTEEILEAGRQELDKIVQEVVATMSGQPSEVSTMADVIVRLNELPVEVLLLAAMVGLNEMAASSVPSGNDPLMRMLEDLDKMEDLEASASVVPDERETPVIQLEPRA